VKKTTKPSARSCKVKKPPTREQWTAAKKELRKSDVKRLLGMATAILGGGYQPPHTMPPYGGRCYVQIYNENMLWLQLAYLMQAYINAWQVSEDCLHPIT
jgi:hypothetical protein